MRDFRYERRLMRRPSRRRRKAIGCWLIAVIAFVALVLGGVLAFSVRDPAPVWTGDERERILREVREVRRQVEEVQADARKGVRRPFEIVVTDDQINLLLGEDEEVRAKLAKHKIESAWVRFSPDGVEAYVLREVGAMTVQFLVTMQVEVEGDRGVRVRVLSARAGAIPAPLAAAQKLADELGRILSSRVTDGRARLSKIALENRQLRLIGSTG